MTLKKCVECGKGLRPDNSKNLCSYHYAQAWRKENRAKVTQKGLGTKMEINLIHKEQTDKEAYENVEILHNLYPNETMTPKEWKRKRLLQLNKEGKVWSK